jgi:hypothetical protein
MKKIFGLLLVPALLLAGGCNNEYDGYSLSKYWVDMATVENPDGEPYFYFNTDEGERMWVAATALRGYRPKNGQRIVANYTILYDAPKDSGYDHDVKLNAAYNVLTREIVALTEENDAQLGHDPLGVRDLWVGAHYLNVEFSYLGKNGRPDINLVRDGSKVDEAGKIHLELRYNSGLIYALSEPPTAQGEPVLYERKGIASFDLSSLQTEGEESVTLVIHSLPAYGAEEETHEVIFTYGAKKVHSTGAPRTFAIDEYSDME